jgi:serine/threonine protein kinase
MRGMSPKVFISGSELIYKEKIGRGAFAIVYRGIAYYLLWNHVTFKGIWKHREVAIKQIQLPEEKKVEIIEDFYKEAKVMIELRHPNIVSLLAVCAKDPDFLLITECMSLGIQLTIVFAFNFVAILILSTFLIILGNLSTLLADPSWIMENDHMRLFALDCCAGMSYLHDLKLIHR